MKYRIETSYSAGCAGEIELPEGLTWRKDVADWWVKWDTVNIILNDGTLIELPLNTDMLECIDWKRPSYTSIYEKDCFDAPIAESG